MKQKPRFIAAAVLVVLLLVATSVCTGVNFHPFATRDVALEYQASTSIEASDLDDRIESRLLLGGVETEVSANGPHSVRVTVDEDAAGSAAHLLARSGGIVVYRLDSTAALVPTDESDLTPKTERRKDGSVEHFFTGPPSALLRVSEATREPTHRLLYDPFAHRTRTVLTKPILDLTNAKAQAEGKSLVFFVKDADRHEALVSEIVGSEPVVFAWGNEIVRIAPFSATFERRHGDSGRPALVVPLGEDVRTYSHARRVAKVLNGPPLARLVPLSRRQVPANWSLAAASIVVPVIVGLVWLVFFRRFDRARPEPWWLLLTTFLLGGLSASFAGLVEQLLFTATPYLDPRVMVLDGGLDAFPVGFAVSVFAVGVVEEGAKFLATWALARSRREFDEPIDGMIYAAAAAIGFAVSENIGYFAGYRLRDGLVVARSISCVPVHVMFSAIWGYALGKQLVSKKARVLPYFILAAVLHGLYDSLIDFSVPHAVPVYLIGLTILFAALLRRALRWGAIDELGDEAPASTGRQYFGVGSKALSALSLVAMLAIGAAMRAVARDADDVHVRASFGVLVQSGGLVLLFGLAAYGLAAAMPLDIVLDELGVTFAGTLHRWERIRGVARTSDHILALRVDEQLRESPFGEPEDIFPFRRGHLLAPTSERGCPGTPSPQGPIGKIQWD